MIKKCHKIRLKTVHQLVDRSQRLSAASAAQAGAIVNTSWLHHVHLSIYEFLLQVGFKRCNRVLILVRVISCSVGFITRWGGRMFQTLMFRWNNEYFPWVYCGGGGGVLLVMARSDPSVIGVHWFRGIVYVGWNTHRCLGMNGLIPQGHAGYKASLLQ